MGPNEEVDGAIEKSRVAISILSLQDYGVRGWIRFINSLFPLKEFVNGEQFIANMSTSSKVLLMYFSSLGRSCRRALGQVCACPIYSD